MPTGPTAILRALANELKRIDLERRAVLSAIAALTPDAKPAPRRKYKPRQSPTAARRPRFRPHKGSRKLRADVYDATIDVVRQANGAIRKQAIRDELRRRGQPVSSVDYHLIRAVKHGDVKRNGTRYLAPKV